MTYKPPTSVVSTQRPYLAVVSQADPDFQRRKHREIEYAFSSGRVFVGDPANRGLYNHYDNTYPVGQPYGGLDANITNNLTTTVGNSTPGLYKGVPTGGWD